MESVHGHLLSTPELIGMLTPKAVAFLNTLVVLIVFKTLAPLFLDANRYLFARVEDGFMSSVLTSANTANAPVSTLLLSKALISLFLLDVIFGGWQVYVIVRAASIALTFAILGIATILLVWLSRCRQERDFGRLHSQGHGCLQSPHRFYPSRVRDTTIAWYFEP